MTSPSERMKSDPILAVDRLMVSYEGKGPVVPAVSGISFDVLRSEVVALVGESGAGKSATAMAILGLLPASASASGAVYFDSIDLLSADSRSARRRRASGMGAIFQDPMGALNPYHRVGDLLREAATGGRSGSWSADRGVEMLEEVEIPDARKRLRHYPHQLSGGQRQRVMIAMALARSPRLLVADEPTTALDVTVQAAIFDLLLRLRDERDMSILLVTHDMGVVADVADRVVVMKNGVVEESANVFSVFDAPRAIYTRELLDAVPRLGSGSRLRGEEWDPQKVVVDVKGLSVVYGRGARAHTAVKNTSFDIKNSEVVALVGESGSGKSSIARTMAGLVSPSDGEIEMGGLRVFGDRMKKAQFPVSVVFQDPGSSLNPSKTIGESIADPLIWQSLARNKREARSVTRDLLEMVGIPADWEVRYPHELSGGQRQRVCIARALAPKPKLVIADEPTSALDVSVQRQILTLLAEVQTQAGFACLFISHDLAVVELIADRVMVMRDGQVVESGSTKDVLARPTHDYTKALIDAVPLPDPVEQRKRRRRPTSSSGRR